MPTIYDFSSGHEETATGEGRIVLFDTAPVNETVWRSASVQHNATCVSATAIAECAAYAAVEGPVVVIATTAQPFEARLLDRADDTFGRVSVIVECQDAADLPMWRSTAWDAVVNPVSTIDAAAAIGLALEESRRRLAERRLIEDYRRRRASLTPNEARVLEAVCEGRLNKQIASELNVSVRTVEQRRRRVFDKMGVDSAVPLAAFTATVRTLAEQQGRRCRRIPATPPRSFAEPNRPAPYAPTGKVPTPATLRFAHGGQAPSTIS